MSETTLTTTPAQGARESRVPPGLWILVVAIALIGVEVRFLQYMPTVFFGDDLDNLLAYRQHEFASTLQQALFQEYFQKYRPVWALALGTLFEAFGPRVGAYMVFNAAVHTVITLIVFAIAWRLSHGRWLVAIAISVASAASRFALYEVTQVTGTVESLPLLWCLVAVYCVSRADQDHVAFWYWSWAAIAAAFLSAHSHERYVVLAPWLALAFLANPSLATLPRGRRIALLLGSSIPFAFNFLYKVLVLDIPFFVGTSGTHISIQPRWIVELAAEALFSLIGFNFGPPHLVGVSIPSLNTLSGWCLASLFALGWCGTIAAGIASVPRDSRKNLRWPALLAAGMLLLLAAPVLSVRMDQRWLYASFIFALLGLAWALSAVRWTRVGVSAAIIGITTASLGIDSIVQPYFGNIFFVNSGRFAEAVKRNVVDSNPADPRDLAIVTSQDHCDWSLLEGKFFILYGGAQRTLHCIASLDSGNALPAGTPIYAVTPLRDR